MHINTATGQIYKTPKDLKVDNVTYPRQIFNDREQLASLGIKPYREERIDSRYYWQGELTKTDNGSEVVGTYTTIERDVEQLKENMIEKVRSTVSALLSKTDWMVIREVDGGSPCPPNIRAYRATLRTESNQKEAEIGALATLADVMLYESTPITETIDTTNVEEDGSEVVTTEERTVNADLCTRFSPVPYDEEEIAKQQADFQATQYQRDRRREYPPIGDQLDALLKYVNLERMAGNDLPEDLDQILAQWLSVKQKYPK